MRGIRASVLVLGLTIAATASAQTTVSVTAEITNLREKPTTESTILQPLKKGAALEVLETSGMWYRVRLKDGSAEGFVSRLMVSAPPAAPPAGGPPLAVAPSVRAVRATAPGGETASDHTATSMGATKTVTEVTTPPRAVPAATPPPPATPASSPKPAAPPRPAAPAPSASAPTPGAPLTPTVPQVFTYQPKTGPVAGKKPKDLNPKDIVDFHVAVDRALPEARLVPGAALRISVVARDKKGNVYSTTDGTLGTRHLNIIPGLMAYDAASATVTAESDPAKIGSALFTVRAEYGEVKKNPKVHILALRPDLAAVLGPEPADVVSLAAEVADTTGPGLLLPGKPVGVRVVATDKEGRKYSTDGGPLPLPLDRLEFGGELVQWQSGGTTMVTPSGDRSAIESKRFLVKVGYRGRPDVTVEHEFRPDFAALDGPAPADVQGFEVTMDGGRDGKIIPGTRTRYNVSVTDKTGRRYDLHSGKLGLPASRLKVTADDMNVEPATGSIEANPDAKKMLNKQYSLTVAYEGREDLTRTLTYEPDFAGLLQSFMFTGDEIVVGGDPGSAGDPGLPGEHGRKGAEGSGQYGRGTDGGSGGPGRAGRPGRRGGRGPNVKVVATEATTLDGATRLVAFEITVPGQDPRYYLRPLDSKPVRIISRGGAGGPGGSGGNGGSGGQGGGGYSTGNGGDGAMGGNGGAGGQGGPGGAIVLVTSSEELKASFELISEGGRGGPGGEPGRGGEAGKAGSIVGAVLGGIANALGMLSGNNTPPPPQDLGTRGEEGPPGMNGDPGMEGEPGQVQQQKEGEALALPRKLSALPMGSVIVIPEKVEKIEKRP